MINSRIKILIIIVPINEISAPIKISVYLLKGIQITKQIVSAIKLMTKHNPMQPTTNLTTHIIIFDKTDRKAKGS